MSESVANPTGSRAIVIGGSVGGLLATRVLAEYFERVVIIERDRLPIEPENRRGVPQGYQIHGLLAAGLRVLSDLFPGLPEELVKGGAMPIDLGGDILWHHFGAYKMRFKSGLMAVTQTRPYLEWHIRRRVLALKNVQCLSETEAKGLVCSEDRGSVTGVIIHSRSDGARQLLAKLVVDASGRGSRAPQWVQSLGYGRPPETDIRIGVGYASRFYRRKEDDLKGAKLLVAFPTPPRETRMGALFPVEGDRWLLGLAGWVNDHPPTDPHGFADFARSLPASDIYEFVKRAEPLGDIVPHKFPSNLRRHYEKLVRLPEGFVALGDALCSFNPIYAQGMTASALEASVLRDCLSTQLRKTGKLDAFPRRFFRAVSRVVDRPWRLAAGEDFRYPQVKGTRAPGTDLVNWYVGHIHRTVARNARVHHEFLKVMNLVNPPTSLLRPRILFAVSKAALQGRHRDYVVGPVR